MTPMKAAYTSYAKYDWCNPVRLPSYFRGGVTKLPHQQKGRENIRKTDAEGAQVSRLRSGGRGRRTDHTRGGKVVSK